MLVTELNRDQLTQVKQHELCQRQEATSYEELVAVDEIISDEEIYSLYAGVVFVEDDFYIRRF